MRALINFRDFGGGQAVDGRRVRTDRLYRSGHLAGLGDEALDRLRRLDFAQVVDLRYADEREKDRSPWPDQVLDRVIAHDSATDADAPHLQVFAAALAGESDIDQAYQAFYTALPFDRWYRPLFAEATRRIAGAPGRVLVHCTAGKDRTGAYVALLLDLLGVPREAVIADYMRSLNAPGFSELRDEVAQRFARRGEAGPTEAQMDALIGVKPAYIEAVFAAVENRCDSTRAYFTQAGVDAATLDRLRETLLTDGGAGPPRFDS